MSELAIEPNLSNPNVNEIVEEIFLTPLQSPLDLLHSTNGNGDISNMLNNQHLYQVRGSQFMTLHFF